MNLFSLARRGIRFHWRSHLGVLCGIAVSTAVLTGALLVGDSLRFSLRRIAETRVADAGAALLSPERFFTLELAGRLSREVDAVVAPALLLSGSIANSDGSRRVNRVQVIGVDDRYWQLGGIDSPFNPEKTGRQVVLNDVLAKKLGLQPDDGLLLRVANPGLLPRDGPFASEADITVPIRGKLKSIAPPDGFGRFSLRASQTAPYNVFVPLSFLQKELELNGRSNLLLAHQSVDLAAMNEALTNQWTLADAALDLVVLDDSGTAELRTSRVFLDDFVCEASAETGMENARILTYFANEFVAGTNATPFSMITAIDVPVVEDSVLPADLGDDGIIINDWMAEDLGIKVGDRIQAAYYVIGSMRTLEEERRDFVVKQVVPRQGLANDRRLMPDMPGLEANDCRDWKPGMPLDLDKVRDKDEEYWDKHRGTPKAFVNLAIGQRLWKNRFGELTAIRYSASRAEVEPLLTASLPPSAFGLEFVPLREQAIKAGAEGIDFGGLFLSMSFFIILAAVLLACMLFVLGLEQRRDEIGALFAMGFTRRKINRIYLMENLAVTLVGGLLGVLAGLVYTRLLLMGLSGIWQGAVGDAAVGFHASPVTILIGAFSGMIVGILAMGWSLRRFGRQTIRQLTAGGSADDLKSRRGNRIRWMVVVASLFGAAALAVLTLRGGAAAMAGGFFGVGTLLLVGGLTLMSVLTRRPPSGVAEHLSLARLGARNLRRQSGRGLVTTGLLAVGIFIVVGVGAFRQYASDQADRPDSGTGGFAYIGESAQAIYRDLNSAEGREALSIDSELLVGVQVTPMRLREGDDASCLNLNRAQRPRLLGVEAEVLAGRFTFAGRIDKTDENPWAVLQRDFGARVVPVIGDQNSIMWALGKKIGDTIEYTNERGDTIDLLLASGVKNSILQGSLLMSEANFIKHFPSASGYQVFLIDADRPLDQDWSDDLGRSLRPYGLELTSAVDRLAAFNQVQNTYISVFQVLGGLGLALGSIGLAVVVARNVLERRSELAVLQAVGFTRKAIHRFVLSEHLLLLLAGVGLGTVSALIAVLPGLLQPGNRVPWPWLLLLVIGILAAGMLWIGLATRAALKGRLVDALRNE